MAGGLELNDPWGPFQPKPFYDSMILTCKRVSELLSFCNIVLSLKKVPDNKNEFLFENLHASTRVTLQHHEGKLLVGVMASS